MSSTDSELRARAEARVKAREDFRIHLFVYLAINGLLWIIWYLGGADLANPWPIFPLIGWGVGLGIHWYITYGRGEDRREAEIAEEMRRLRGRS
jgi:hypothetical protein